VPIKGTREGGLWLIDEEVYGSYLAPGLGRDYVPNVIFSCARQALEIPGFSGGRLGDILISMAKPRPFGGLRAAPILLLLLFLAPLFARPALSAERDDAALVAALRAGGHVLYFRHSATDWTQNDQVRQAGDWQSCDGAKMRQLSDAGRMTAQLIGLAIRTLAIPVGEVLSSEYCLSRWGRNSSRETRVCGQVPTTLDFSIFTSRSNPPSIMDGVWGDQLRETFVGSHRKRDFKRAPDRRDKGYCLCCEKMGELSGASFY